MLNHISSQSENHSVWASWYGQVILLLRTIFMMALFIALWNILASDSCLKVFLYLINNSSTLQDKKVLSLIAKLVFEFKVFQSLKLSQ